MSVDFGYTLGATAGAGVGLVTGSGVYFGEPLGIPAGMVLAARHNNKIAKSLEEARK